MIQMLIKHFGIVLEEQEDLVESELLLVLIKYKIGLNHIILFKSIIFSIKHKLKLHKILNKKNNGMVHLWHNMDNGQMLINKNNKLLINNINFFNKINLKNKYLIKKEYN